MGPKATETLCAMNNGFGPGTADEPVKGYIKGRVFKMRSNIRANPLSTTLEAAKELRVGDNSRSALGSKLKSERLDN